MILLPRLSSVPKSQQELTWGAFCCADEDITDAVGAYSDSFDQFFYLNEIRTCSTAGKKSEGLKGLYRKAAIAYFPGCYCNIYIYTCIYFTYI